MFLCFYLLCVTGLITPSMTREFLVIWEVNYTRIVVMAKWGFYPQCISNVFVVNKIGFSVGCPAFFVLAELVDASDGEETYQQGSLIDAR